MADTFRKIQSLNAETIHELFGSFDAEQEDLEKFKSYFITNKFYESFRSNFPLRIAIGNKGTGKSAILRASYIEDSINPDCVCVSLSASDLISRADNLPADALKAINHWKSVFVTEAASQMLSSDILEMTESDNSRLASSLPKLINWISEIASKKTKGSSDILVQAGFNLDSIKKIVFYIDDLDRGWDGRAAGVHFVNSILNACYDISKKEKNIQFRIGIRWDLWDSISRVNQDIDKIRQNAIFLRWSNHEIYLIAAARVAKYFNLSFDYKLYLDGSTDQNKLSEFFDLILERTFYGYGKWDKTSTRHVVLSMTRNRPRDLLNLLTLAAEEANKKNKVVIDSKDLQDVFPRYSEERLNDLILEYGTRMIGLDSLLFSFKPSKTTRKTSENFRFTNDKISSHIQSFLKSNSNRVRFANEKIAPDFRMIIDFLYRIDFLQAWHHRPDGGIERVNFQDRQHAISANVELGYSWEVLPAYRWAIQPTKILDVISSLNNYE